MESSTEEYMTELMRRNRDSAKRVWGSQYDSESAIYTDLISSFIELKSAVGQSCTVLDAVMSLIKTPVAFTSSYSQMLLFAAAVDLMEGVKQIFPFK